MRLGWLGLVLALTVAGCGEGSIGGSGGSAGSGGTGGMGGQSFPARPGYCTTWTERTRFSIMCLQSDGTWKPFLRPQSPGDDPNLCGGGIPQLAGVAGDGMLVAFERCMGEHTAITVQRATGSGWEPVAGPVNADNAGMLAPIYSQFGPTLAQFQGQIYAFWTRSTQAFEAVLSHYTGSAWQHTPVATVPEGVIRHPSILDAGDAVYIYYGEPSPSVWNLSTGTPVALGAVAVGAGESTLYTSLARWRGQLVLAYSSGPANASWADTIIRIKVAFHNGGTGWTVDPASIEETPGHDGMVPFLFTIADQLYLMYADYTTEGLPNLVGSPFRFRVKKWNGAGWDRVGDESPTVGNSQRLEFLLDGDTVFVSVVRPVANPSSGLISGEHIVLGWRAGRFGQVGEVLSRGPSWEPRPGAVVPPPP